MAARNIVVVGASAGGVEALKKLAGRLPADFPAAVFVVLHTSPESPSFLPNILRRSGPLPAEHARDGEAVRPGRIYVAPPDHHLMVHDGLVRLLRGPSENRHRPAIDPLFRSAAQAHGNRVIGVLLSGLLDDGVSGLQAIKSRGGLAVVQHPDSAAFPDMPRNALEYVAVDHAVPIEELGGLLQRLAAQPVAAEKMMPSKRLEQEVRLAELDMTEIENEGRAGKPSTLVCPDCDGTLWELQEGDVLRFQCRVGHAYTADTLVSAKAEAMENALWAALRALEEDASLGRRMAARSRQHGHETSARRYERNADTRSAHAQVLRDILLQTGRAQGGKLAEEPQQPTGT